VLAWWFIIRQGRQTNLTLETQRRKDKERLSLCAFASLREIPGFVLITGGLL
jgi:hypothetical protein